MRKFLLVALGGSALLGLFIFAGSVQAQQGPERICQWAMNANGIPSCVDVGPNQSVNGLTTYPFWVTEGVADPCQEPSVAKSSVAISASSAATAKLVGAISGKAVYVCGFSLSIAPSATAADTAQFEYGTKVSSDCDTDATALTGTYGNGDLTSAAGVATISNSGPGTIFATPASQEVCIVTAGTAVSVQGVLTYVQQ